MGVTLHQLTLEILNFFDKHSVDEFSLCKQEYEDFLAWVVGPLQDRLGHQKFNTLFIEKILFIGAEKSTDDNLITHNHFVKILLERIQTVIENKGAMSYSPEIYALCLTLLCLPEKMISSYNKINLIKKLLPLTNLWNWRIYDLLKKVIAQNEDQLIPLVWQKVRKTFMSNNLHISSQPFLDLLVADGLTNFFIIAKKYDILCQHLNDTITQYEKKQLHHNPIKKSVHSLKKMAIRGIAWCLISNTEPYKQKDACTLNNPCTLGTLIKKKPFNMSSQEILDLVAKDIKVHCASEVKKLNTESKITLCKKWKNNDRNFHEYKIRSFAKCIAPELSFAKRKKWVDAIEKYLNDMITKISKEVIQPKKWFIPQGLIDWWYGK